jgi:hypothetical protein
MSLGSDTYVCGFSAKDIQDALINDPKLAKDMQKNPEVLQQLLALTKIPEESKESNDESNDDTYVFGPSATDIQDALIDDPELAKDMQKYPEVLEQLLEIAKSKK